jgi:hypothetical protein
MAVPNLPPEILISIIEFCVGNHYCDKNALLELRTVCRLFDHVLKPFVLHTLQLEFTRMDKISQKKRRPLCPAALQRIGPSCRALYLDMMVVRDEGTMPAP